MHAEGSDNVHSLKDSNGKQNIQFQNKISWQ